MRNLPGQAKADGYRRLAGRFGVDRLGTALLVKWLSEGDDADQQWGRLARAINEAGPRRRWPGPAARLTPGEVRLLTLLAAGLGVAAAAVVLGRAVSTLRAQIKTATVRLGARSTTEAVAIGIRSGQVRPPNGCPA